MTTSTRTRSALLSVAAAATLALSACSTTDDAVAPASNDSPVTQSQAAVEPAADHDALDDRYDDHAPAPAQAPAPAPAPSPGAGCEWDHDDQEWDDCDDDRDDWDGDWDDQDDDDRDDDDD